MTLSYHQKPGGHKRPKATTYAVLYEGIRVGAIVLVALVLADVLLALFLPASETATDSLRSSILPQLTDMKYWLRKVLLSGGGSLIYGLFAWHIKRRKSSIRA